MTISSCSLCLVGNSNHEPMSCHLQQMLKSKRKLCFGQMFKEVDRGYDAIQHYPECKLPYQDWCHMATNGPLSELHAMAAQLGLLRAWFQNKLGHPHSDLTPAKRAQALKLGVQAVRTYELLQRCYPQTLGKGVLPRLMEGQG